MSAKLDLPSDGPYASYETDYFPPLTVSEVELPTMLSEAEALGQALDQDKASRKSSKTKIGMLCKQPFTTNWLIEQQANALTQAGYEVHLLCPYPESDNITPGRFARDEYRDGIYIHRVQPKEVTLSLPFLKQPTDFFYKGIVHSLCLALFNRHNAWHALIDRFIQFYGIDILHVHGLSLLDTALSVAKKRNLPVVADMQEHYPALMEMRKSGPSGVGGRHARKRWESIESRGILKADCILVNTGAAAARMIDKLIKQDDSSNKCDPDKIAVVPNMIDIDKFANLPLSNDIMRQYKSCFLMVYAGSLNNPQNGLSTILEALSILKPEIPELFFVAAGNLPRFYRRELEEKLDRLGLQLRVQFFDQADAEAVANYVEASDLCIVPDIANDQSETTFPGSAYLYHLLRKPIVASDSGPIADYVKQTEGGLTYPSGDANELANQIRRLYYDVELKKVLGDSGQNAILTQFNWQQTAAPLLLSAYGRINAKIPKH